MERPIRIVDLQSGQELSAVATFRHLEAQHIGTVRGYLDSLPPQAETEPVTDQRTSTRNGVGARAIEGALES